MKHIDPFQNRRPSRLLLSIGGYVPLQSAAVRVVLGAVLFACLSVGAFAGVIHVVPGGTGDGSSWASGKDLAAALSGAAGGSELWVKAGTYKPTTGADSNATFQLKSGVALYGGFAGNETAVTQRNSDPATNGTILSGDLGVPNNASDNTLHVVTGSGTDDTAILDGFTVTGGNANSLGGGMSNLGGSPTLSNLIFTGNSSQNRGGAIFNFEGHSTLTNVTFSANSAGYGGGIYQQGGSLSLTNVTFSSNSAANFGGGMFTTSSSHVTLSHVTFSSNSASFYGGGIFNDSGSLTLTDVTFSGNSVNSALGYGGGIYNTGSLTLTEVIFSDNSAQSGGGMYSSGNLTLTEVTFSGNSAQSGGGMYHSGSLTLTNVAVSGNSALYGGGIYLSGASKTLTNVTFNSNSASQGGGGIYNIAGSLRLTNVTFSGNSAGSGGGIASNDTKLMLTDAIFSGNSAARGAAITSANSSNGSTLTLTRCNFSSNSSQSGAVISNEATMVLTDVLFSGNSGGGVAHFVASATLTNVTFSGNTGTGFATYDFGPDLEQGFLFNPTLTNVTFGGNSSTAISIHGTATLRNCILWGNGGGIDLQPTDGGSSTVNIANSIVQGGGFPGAINADPKLSPLQDNGGPTLTMVPQPGSAAIDAAAPNMTVTTAPVVAGTHSVAVNDTLGLVPGLLVAIFDPGQTIAEVVKIASVSGNSFTATFAQAHPVGAEVILATDQRGFERPVNNRNDIGAAEAAYTTLTGPATTPSYGQAFNVTATVANATATGQEVVQFVVDGMNHGAPVMLVNGSATTSFSWLTAASHQITAVYTNGGGSPEGNSNTLTQHVAKTTPVINWSNPADITYGTPLSVAQLNATVAPAAAGTFVYTPAAGTVFDAGNGQTLSVTFTPADTDNYQTPGAQTVSINVNPAPANVMLSNLTQTYGATGPVTVMTTPAGLGVVTTYTGIEGTNYPQSQTPPTAAGSYSVVATLTDSNYSASPGIGTLVIQKATPTVTWNTPADITYGTGLSASELNATASVPGTFVYTPAAGTVLDAGNGQTLSVTFTPADTGNYQTPAARTVSINVSPAPANVMLSNLTQTYGATGPVTVMTTPAGLGVVTTCTGIDGTNYPQSQTPPTAAGSYSVVATLTDSNYTASPGVGTLVIQKATPTITWNNPADITYGAGLSDSELNATASVPGTLVYTPAAGTVLDAGNGQMLSVTFTQADTDNYQTPAAQTVSIDVNQAPANVMLSNLTQTYGATGPVTVMTTPAGLDAVTTYIGIDGTNYPPSQTPPTAAGSYSVVATLTNSNYSASPGIGTLVIQKVLTVVTVTSSKNPSAFGDAVSFTATLAPSTLLGTVQFKIDGADFGAPVTVTHGVAVSGSISTLAAGNRAITAVFTAGVNQSYEDSTGSLTQTVAVPVKINGGGKLSEAIHFSFNVHPEQPGTSASGYKGHLEFRDTSVAGGFLFRSSAITSEYASDSVHGTFSGTGKLNDMAGYSFVVTVEDRGKQGAGNDKFRIVIYSPNGSLRYDSDAQTGANGGLLSSGKVKIHYNADSKAVSLSSGTLTYVAGI